VNPEKPLLWVLREELGLTDTKFGCGVGACGACTVHLAGEAVRSCVVPVSAASGSSIVTIEGLAASAGLPKDALHPVQRAWICTCSRHGMSLIRRNGMQRKVLVTGANGHIGNNLVRALARGGDRVVAGVRDPSNRTVLNGLDCRIANLDLLDKTSIASSLKGVEVLYQVGAVFQHWSKDPETDIYGANLEATRNVIEAAVEAGVHRVVYVSSLIALDRTILPITENSWNSGTTNVYARSKTDSEKLAWELAGKHGLSMVSVLPGATIGVNCFNMTPTMNLLNTVLQGKLAVNPGFYFNFVDVEDVVSGLLAAAERGRAGERYLLANENCMGVGDIVRIAQGTFPERKIRTPGRPPRAMMWMIAVLMEMAGRLRGQEPELQRNYLSEFTVRERCDISKARRELGFLPQKPHRAVLEALRYLDGLSDPGLLDSEGHPA